MGQQNLPAGQAGRDAGHEQSVSLTADVEFLCSSARASRAMFTREIASRQRPLLAQQLERGRASGHFRADLDPTLAAQSLNLFPFLTRRVTAQALGLKYEGEELERLIAHTARLFLHGIASKP
jgi:hypothetical protein